MYWSSVHHTARPGLLGRIPRKKYNQQFQINFFGTMDMIRSIIPHFRQKHRGVIIGVISSPDHSSLPMISSVYASNFALEGFSQGLSPEAASQGVIVKLVVRLGGITKTMIREHATTRLTNPSLADYYHFV